jgi:hypothetical protein
MHAHHPQVGGQAGWVDILLALRKGDFLIRSFS